MKRTAFCTWTLLAASVLLRAQLTIPGVGIAHFPDGSLHTIRGVAANFIVDPRALASAGVASFSDSAGLTAENGTVRMLRANGNVLSEYHSSEPTPLLNVDTRAETAAVWLPSKHTLLRWDGTQFVETVVDDSSFGGTVTFVNLASYTTAQFYVVRGDLSVTRFSVSLPTGRVTSADTEPGARGSVFAQQGWIVWQDEWGLVAERHDGNRQTAQLSRQAMPAGDLTMERMSDHWLHVVSRSTGTGWAVYLNADRLNVFFLPPPVAEAAR